MGYTFWCLVSTPELLAALVVAALVALHQALFIVKGYKVYKDGLQPESLADGNWLVKQHQQGVKGLQGWPTARVSG